MWELLGKGARVFVTYDSPSSRRLISASESVVVAAASQLRRTDEEQRSTTREPHRPEYRSRGAVAPPLPGHLLTSVLACNQAVHLPDITHESELIGPTSNEAQGGCKGARRWMSSRSAELTYRSGASGGTVWRAWAKRCLCPVGAMSGLHCRHGSRQLDRRRVGLAALRRELSA